MKNRILGIVAALALLAVPAAAQGFGQVSLAPLNGANCNYAPTTAIDASTGVLYGCGNDHVYSDGHTLGTFQGVTSTAITTGNFTVLTGPTTIKIPAGKANFAGKTVRVKYRGVYTTGAASLLNTELSFCTIAGCASGTVVSPVGCVVISTNQANVLANGQFDGECMFTVAATGTSGTVMAKSSVSFQLGAATSAALSQFEDLATAVSTAIDLTVDEYLTLQFKFTTSNAGNAATAQIVSAEIIG